MLSLSLSVSLSRKECLSACLSSLKRKEAGQGWRGAGRRRGGSDARAGGRKERMAGPKNLSSLSGRRGRQAGRAAWEEDSGGMAWEVATGGLCRSKASLKAYMPVEVEKSSMALCFCTKAALLSLSLSGRKRKKKERMRQEETTGEAGKRSQQKIFREKKLSGKGIRHVRAGRVAGGTWTLHAHGNGAGAGGVGRNPPTCLACLSPTNKNTAR